MSVLRLQVRIDPLRLGRVWQLQPAVIHQLVIPLTCAGHIFEVEEQRNPDPRV
jgi:hypothetical protein